MNIKSLLLGSAAALVAASGAQAADAIVAPEPEAVEYVRVCDAYGAGYFYIPGTETCLRIHGYVRYDAAAGRDAYDGSDAKTWRKNSRFTLRTSTASETELGTLKTYTENRFNFTDGFQGGHTLNFAYIQLGGLRLGLDESAFHTFTGYLGDIINDDVVAAGVYRTNLISYTFTGGNGFSAILSLEQGGDAYVNHDDFINEEDRLISNRIDDYMPHVVGGLKFAQGWGSIAAVAAYDANLEEWAGKVRLDVNVTDKVSVWVQGGYSSYEDDIGMYGNWGGDWAVWGGAKFVASEKATINVQAAYEDWGKTAVAANVAYQLVPGFTITPEINYTRWDSDHPARLAGGNKDAFGGIIRFQRSF
ncbi:porin [Ochrobactrum sp. 695/2009]|nr:porin [Brucella intermedia]PJR90142.1 porin [Ochrobactrum sp. 721/2009]PJT16570.1 porin [Ochrobactrum sp. 720/2009]PJT26392.1 porin [Ochrobactrum sp. 715/2009]PJT31704.1 porin [Ochrobactrum sp. 695/2009]PJT35911.1 porin [Ochrobactrum sp. 689/2009]